MRATWDAAARSERADSFVGDPATGREELEGLFGRLGGDPRGGVCVEIGCGPGRMTASLAERFDRVIALDVSPAMLEAARASVTARNVEFRLVTGVRLDGLDDSVADAVVCYLVLQHLPSRGLVEAYLAEIARVLAPAGQAFVQLPILEPGLRPALRRALRGIAVPLVARLSRGVARQPAYRGFRLTGPELAAALASAGLRVAARDESDTSPYRYASEVFLRLRRA